MLEFKKIGIIGLGLIGGSLGLLIRKKFPQACLVGVSPREETIKLALKNKIIDYGYQEISSIQQDLDLAIIATPINQIIKSIQEISLQMSNELIITDVASIKKTICDYKFTLKPNHYFFPGHPMAGIEKTGLEWADAKIMENAKYILLKSNQPQFKKLKTFLECLNFKLIIMKTASEHDKILTFASHLPYLMASLTVEAGSGLNEVERKLFPQVISTGFKDTTRVAESSPVWGKDICLNNQKNIVKAIKNVKNNLTKLEKLIKTNQFLELENWLNQIKSRRKNYYL